MTKEILEQLNQEVEINTQIGQRWGRENAAKLGKVIEDTQLIWGKGTWVRSESGKWVVSRDPRFGGQASILELFKK